MIQSILMFAAALLGQIIGASLLPKTNGFQDLKWTAISLLSFGMSLFVISLLIKRGFALSIVVPLLSGLVPLTVGLVAIWFQGEPASYAKIAMLIAACALISLAGFIS
ncbi:hypothetical protein D6851_00740 [Altericroceibacterium spongiae]|uniref:EamA family transporter n=2 Tax=Altericroceibacterium spongiae TaxID=2320269 RepID=A0A420EQW2_9SPHN|nr:hypothetical protein D6851_00740 [Altericroceibacterium spongiae]